MLGVMIKQPADNLDYDIDFGRWLPQDDIIIGVQATVTPNEDDGVQAHSARISSPDVKVWLRGGKDGETYKVSVVVNTLGGRVKETDFKVRVRDC